jgi:hypothetical protein
MYTKIISAIVLAFAINILAAQKNIDQVFRKYKNDEGVAYMNFTGDVLKAMNDAKGDIRSTVENVEIIIFKKGDDISKDDQPKIASVLTRDKFDLLLDIKNEGQKVKLYAVDSGAFLNKVYAQVKMSDMNAYFILSGKIIFEELSKLGMDFNSKDGLKVLNGK